MTAPGAARPFPGRHALVRLTSLGLLVALLLPAVAAAAAEEKTAWVPDPVTGYYRPAGGAKEVDAAIRRALIF